MGWVDYIKIEVLIAGLLQPLEMLEKGPIFQFLLEKLENNILFSP